MSNQSGPRDWLSGGRHWDEIPVSGSSTPPPRRPVAAFRVAEPAPSRPGSRLWGLLSFVIGGGALFALYASSQWPGRVSPNLGLIGGVLAIFFGIVAWRRRRHPGKAISIVFPAAAIGAGLLSIFSAAALTGMLTTGPAAQAAAVPPARQAAVSDLSPTTAASSPTTSDGAVPSPAPAPAPVQLPARPSATQMTMAQTLGTLQFLLQRTRGPDGLQSPALAVTSAGGVVDPFSVTPDRILTILPANTTLSYTVSVDRRNYAVTLTDNSTPSLVARYDTVNGVVEFG